MKALAALLSIALIFAFATTVIAMPGAEQNIMTGKVAETMDVGGYTYCNLETGGQKVWVAIPKAKIKVGQTVKIQPGQPMYNFHSKSLNRTFDMIIFSGGLAE